MTTFANCIWRLLLDELVGGSCECGSALTLTLFDCFAATTHRQRSQNVRNQLLGGFPALIPKSMEGSLVAEQLPGWVPAAKTGEESRMRKIRRNQKVSFPHSTL